MSPLFTINSGKKIQLQKFYLFLSALLILSILICNLKRMSYLCMNANDFGIQLQSMIELSTLKGFNPFSTIMQINIFNDHFDPGMILLSLPMIIFGPHHGLPIIVEWLSFLFMIFFLFLTLEKKTPWDLTFLIPLTLIVFSRSLLQGLEFPVHPGTSAMFVLFITTFCIIHNKGPVLIFLLSLLSCSFREIIPFMFVAMGAIYLLQGQFKKGLPVFLASSLWLFIFFVLRPKYLGSTADYGQGIISGMGKIGFAERLALLTHKLSAFHVLEWKPFAGFLFISLLVLKKEITNLKQFLLHPLIPLYTYTLVGITIHLLAGRMAHHHSVSIATPLLTFLCYYPYLEKNIFSKHWIVMASLILTVGTGLSRYTKFLRNTFGSQGPNCDMGKENSVAIDEFTTFMKTLPSDANYLATDTAATAILTPGRRVYEYAFFRNHPKYYDYIVWDRNTKTDYWPLIYPEAQRILEKCRGQGQLLFQNSSYTVLSGKFDKNCFEGDRFAIFKKLNAY